MGSLHRFERRVVTASLTDTAAEVARRMRDFRVGCVVVTRGERPIGIVTDRDLALRVVAEGRDPTSTVVADIVTYDATTVPVDAEIDTVARLMRKKGIRRVPIVNGTGAVVGIVTADDLTMLLGSELADLSAGLSLAVDSDESR